MKKTHILIVLTTAVMFVFSFAASVVTNVAKYSSTAEKTVTLEIDDSTFSLAGMALAKSVSPAADNATAEKQSFYVQLKNGFFKTYVDEKPVYINELLFSEDETKVQIVETEKGEINGVFLGFSIDNETEPVFTIEHLTRDNLEKLVNQGYLSLDETDNAIHLYANWSDDISGENPLDIPEPEESPAPETETEAGGEEEETDPSGTIPELPPDNQTGTAEVAKKPETEAGADE